MAKQVRFTASLDADLKKKLEAIGEKNFRKLNGELNVAVEFYLKYGVTEVKFVDSKEEDVPPTIGQDPVVSTDKPKEDAPPVVEAPPMEPVPTIGNRNEDEIKALNKSGVKSRRI